MAHTDGHTCQCFQSYGLVENVHPDPDLHKSLDRACFPLLTSDSCHSLECKVVSLLTKFISLPGLGHSVDYEQDEIGSASILYALAPETKGGMEPDFGQAGPLLGSCLSSPSSPAIVSRANSLRLGSGDELFPSQVIDGDASSERGCSVEEEVHSLAGLEREILGADSGFEFPDSGAGEILASVCLNNLGRKQFLVS